MSFLSYKYNSNPLRPINTFFYIVPSGAYLFQTHLRGAGWGGGLSILTKTMALVLHRELECKVEKLKCKKSEVMQPRIKNKPELPADD